MVDDLSLKKKKRKRKASFEQKRVTLGADQRRDKRPQADRRLGQQQKQQRLQQQQQQQQRGPNASETMRQAPVAPNRVRVGCGGRARNWWRLALLAAALLLLVTVSLVRVTHCQDSNSNSNKPTTAPTGSQTGADVGRQQEAAQLASAPTSQEGSASEQAGRARTRGKLTGSESEEARRAKQATTSPPPPPPSSSNETTTTTTTTTSIETNAHSSNSLISGHTKLTGHLRFEFQRYDGWYNNLANSNWGTPNSRLRRKVAPAYSDGVYQMTDEGRPSARLLSQRMMRGDDGLASRRNLTTLFAFFGQLISSEILMASESGCPIEMHRIKIEKCDPMYDRDCRGGRTMPFYRAAYDQQTGQSPNLPREQLNRVTSWIDGSFIYSTSETWLNTMRSFDGRGTLKMAHLQPALGAASGGPTSSANGGALGDAYLAETVSALMADDHHRAQDRWPSGPSGPSGAGAGGGEVPLSLFGYPVRNNQRAPLINHMPAHHLQMKKAERMFLLGDPRTNQNPMILSFGILFYRWHNVLAERIHAQHPDWSDEEIFQRARRLVIASLQNILLYEYLPTLLDTPPPPPSPPPSPYQAARAPLAQGVARRTNATGSAPASTTSAAHQEADLIELYVGGQSLSESQYDQHDLIRPYSGYKPDLHPGISHAFQSSAFRFGHTMIPPGLYLRDDQCNFLKTRQGYKGVRLCSTWWNAEEVVSRVGIEQLLMGGASQIAEREDYVLCNDVRDKLYGPLDFSRRDLAALNIMRGRDNGLADYNTFRRAFKLPRITRWRDINPPLYAKQPHLFEELARLYQNRLDNVDLYIGGMLESDLERGRPGPLFRRIIKEQFERLRDSDRFWFENLDSGIFSEQEIEEIRSIKLYDIIVNATLIPETAIQRNVFQFATSSRDPCPQPGQLSSRELQPCYIVKGHSYFKGNERTYLFVCLTLVAVPMLCGLCARQVVEFQERKRRQFKTKQEYERNLAGSTRKLVALDASGGGASFKSSSATGRHAGRRRSHADDADADADDHADPDDDEQSNQQNGAGGRRAQAAPSSSAGEPPTRAAESEKCEKIYAKEWLHSDLRRKIKLRFGPAPDENIYVLDRMGQVQRKLDLSQPDCARIVVEMSVSSGQPLGRAQAFSLISVAPQHPLKAAVSSGSSGGSSASTSGHSDTIGSGTSTLSLISGSSVNTANSASCEQQPTADELDQPVDHKPMALIRAAHNYDLVLQFSSVQYRRKFIFKLQTYLRLINKSMTLYRVRRDIMLANAETKERRKERLEQFFREAYALTFGAGQQQEPQATGPPMSAGHGDKVSPDIGLVMRTSLSRQEFAEALGMRADSLFVSQMFNCIDKDRNGQISFQEFLELVVKFSRGNADDKLRIVFDMCDHSARGLIEKRDLVQVLRSLVDMAKTSSLEEERVLESIEAMFKSVGLQDKRLLDYDDFKLIFSAHQQLQAACRAQLQAGDQGPLFLDQTSGAYSAPIGLDMKGAKRNFFSSVGGGQADATSGALAGELLIAEGAPLQPAPKPKTGPVLATFAGSAGQRQQQQQRARTASASGKGLLRRASHLWRALITELEEHRQDIVYLLMFYVIVAVLFLERFVNYSFLSEHMDLRHVMGVGIAITRGSAASLSFCYAMLLLSMCRNLMTRIRTMSVREYIPLDSHVKFHKIVAITALLMTLLHTVGHCINFYHVSQQPVEHLRCLTKEMQFSAESRPTFFYWVFQTVTGSTGLALWVLCSIVYAFAQHRVRMKAYSFFWSTHQLHYLIYALTLLHGSSKLTGSPRFWIFFIIPASLFALDKIMSLQAKLWQLEIFETECLPSDVIALKFARPPSFKFLSGQWVRVACTAFRPHEFHAFTLTSAPQDDFLSIHVRAHGPWTWKLRNLFDAANLQYLNHHQTAAAAAAKRQLLHERLPPRIRIEGPFGGGNQDWYKYEVAVMIGGGIGVTPYASILNDLVFGTSTNRYSATNYKKVYFIWICPSHKSFEWFIDVLRDVEERDVTNLLEMHIYITQFFHKFDLRTTMLYICENHFQRISNKSLFTGLKAINHFERPDIAKLLQEVQNKHSRVSKVGVFSCGPKRLTKSVTEACEKVNKRRKLPFFVHQYENFS